MTYDSKLGNEMSADSPGSLSRRTALMAMGAAGIASLVAAPRFSPVWAQDATPAAGDLEAYPEIEVLAGEYYFELPAEVEGGLTRVTMVNEGMEGHHAIFLRMNDDVTQEDVDAAAASPDFFQFLSLGDMIGGPNGAPIEGGRATVILDLVPGNYQVVCAIPDAEGMPHYMHGMIAPLTVTESASALDAPAADLTVDLVDFAFDHLPATVATGPQVWEVINVGQEPHEIVVVQLAEGVTFEMLEGMFGIGAPSPEASPASAASPEAEMAAGGEEMGPPPFTEVGGTAPKFPGFTNWAVLDLEPGAYAALCFIPSPANGMAPHFVLGMIMGFTAE